MSGNPEEGFDGQIFDSGHVQGRPQQQHQPSRYNQNASTSASPDDVQLHRHHSDGSAVGQNSEYSATSTNRPLMGAAPANNDAYFDNSASTSQLAQERSKMQKGSKSGNEGGELGRRQSTRLTRRGRNLVKPERQPAPQPGDPHYHTYMRQGLDVTAPAGPNSRTRRRNILTRGDNTAVAALSNSNSINEDLNGYHHATPKEGGVRFANLKASKKKRSCPGPWTIYIRFITFWAPAPLLSLCGMPNPQMQTAWREKIGLVSIIILIMAAIGFLTFALQQILCGLSGTQNRVRYNSLSPDEAIISGQAYNLKHFNHPDTEMTGSGSILGDPVNAKFMDLSLLFQNPNGNCKGVLKYNSGFANSNGNVVSVFPCQMVNPNSLKNNIDTSAQFDPSLCHNKASQRNALGRIPKRPVYYTWEDIKQKGQNMVLYNGAVLDLKRLDWLLPDVKAPQKYQNLKKGKYHGRDMSLYFAADGSKSGDCLKDLLQVGSIDTASIGCMASNIILYTSLVVILGAVFAKFFMAVYFGWFMSRSLGAIKSETPEERRARLENIEDWADHNNHVGAVEPITLQHSVVNPPTRKLPWLPTVSRYSQFNPGDEPAARRMPQRGRGNANPHSLASGYFNSMYLGDNSSFSGVNAFADPALSSGNHTDSNRDVVSSVPSQTGLVSYPVGNLPTNSMLQTQAPGTPLIVESPYDFSLAYTLLLVTCYSEGSYGIRTTLDSLAGTDYPSSHKCIFVICDGLIKGEGEDMYTPDVCLSMMKDFVIPPDRVQPYTYVAIASGSKRRNMAKIYAGYYAPGENSPESAKREPVPMILVVKCGTPEEANDRKPGNRGKRDSQVLLMQFLQHVMFDDRMTELEYELFNAMWNVTKVTPDNFEICLMVDADTKIYGDSVTRMVATMVKDPQIMGLCGETKIANKRDSWVSAIQVFEYYISHHQAKAFESVFGGVTCLPGCFCMYRIKAPKGSNNFWVPILANPNIVENYSEYIVDTLHKKNLLLLGEDRYLSTLMLRTFPKRKMMFVPSAVCKTVVPNEFKVLLSQRRRWINSTVHNLMELVLVKDLCGTFCLSMQFVIFMELIGTVALPAAISFTLYIIIISTFTRPVPYLPLALLACILFLPAILIGLTSRKMVYVGWMFIYLFSLPVWNFVLPAYAYWHFDDFSWGETRKVTGEGKDTGHGDAEGEFDSSMIIMKRWCDFEAEKRRKTRAIFNDAPELRDVALGLSGTPHSEKNSPMFMVGGGHDTPLTEKSSRMSHDDPDAGTEDGSASKSVISSGHAGSSTTGGGQMSRLHQAVAAVASSDQDSRRMSVAADNIEKLGYMTPHIIPTIASGTPPRTGSSNRISSYGSNNNSGFMSSPNGNQYAFSQLSGGTPPIPAMPAGMRLSTSDRSSRRFSGGVSPSMSQNSGGSNGHNNNNDHSPIPPPPPPPPHQQQQQ
ncbi:Chitin synthase, class 3 [Mycoemilia scoparia]|uniref:chitin synthase n=1 Tax=Mycoemilia scoparia TaxID=417184 RepID=A0A9W8DK71_9FUNG|nr:Chitin synthase, class 3 [Mycoemilia scoparia]